MLVQQAARELQKAVKALAVCHAADEDVLRRAGRPLPSPAVAHQLLEWRLGRPCCAPLPRRGPIRRGPI
jgi:hypothetical protein